MMGSGPFDKLTEDYDRWFEQYDPIYQSELAAVRAALPPSGRGIEIGVGTGRFAAPLGIGEGVEPSEEMARIARNRGIKVIRGVAEDIPIQSGEYDYALMVTTICFLHDPDKAIEEILRVTKPEGRIILGFVDKDSL
jgi:SAM-dependent methyltransferase